MNGKMKSLLCTAGIVVLCAGFAGCGQKKEAVITSEDEDITQSVKEYETLSVSKAQKFGYDDLVVDSLKYMMSEEAVKNSLGEPVAIYNASEKQNVEDIMDEKVYSYNDLSLIFSKINGDYKLTAAASVSNEDVFARGIKVGDNIDRLLDLFYRDQNCMNNEFYSEDKTTSIGKMLYGNFTIDSLENVKTSNKVEYGIINYNGYSSLETADSYSVEFTYFEPPYMGSYATIDDAFAQMSVDIDNKGIITGIRWYYYPQQ